MSTGNDHLSRIRGARDFVESTDRRTTNYILGRQPDEEGEFELGEAPLSQSILDIAQEILYENLCTIVDRVTEGPASLEQFSIANTNRNITPVQHLPIDELPDEARIDDLIENYERLDLPETWYDESPPPKLQFIRVQEPGGNAIVGLQEYSRTQIVGSSRRAKFIHREQGYNMLEDEVLSIPERVHAVCYDGYVYISSPKAFERMFDLRDQYRQEVDDVFNELEDQNIRIGDDSILESFKRDIRCLRRVHEIKRHRVHESATPDKIIDIADRYNVPVTVAQDNGELVLNVDDLRKRWKILDLLGDNYLQSEMTENQYNADGKEIVE